MTGRKLRVDGAQTREAILCAAEEEFAEKGFALASVRTICQRAEANVALANRYFGSKEELYRTVARRLFGELGAPLAEIPKKAVDAASWRAAVREWVDDMLYMTLPTEKAQKLCAGLFRHEVTAPTEFYAEFKRDFGAPVFNSLETLIHMAEKDERKVALISASIWAQVSVYALADAKWTAVFRPKGLKLTEWRESIVNHITESLFKEVSL